MNLSKSQISKNHTRNKCKSVDILIYSGTLIVEFYDWLRNEWKFTLTVKKFVQIEEYFPWIKLRIIDNGLMLLCGEYLEVGFTP
ncbi:CLUMA_CG009628, isoform A [Clunio marinus]|uniref:CLUMA_CG009628, isoform A n=1 Tax=Clunio marinus TaxID=568069 RepID=A0A1J1I7G4_9DIPT|nr:CLUMA_CG009628, isoform A [Clunio marinus]